MFSLIQEIKIGNLLVYLAKNIQELSLTKALKLLYIIDETATKETGSPITWLTYQVWEMGPVANEVYDNLKKNETNLFSKYIKTEAVKKQYNTKSYDTLLILPNADFNDGEFNDYEMALIDQIIAKYGNMTALNLVNILHEKDTLWHKKVQENELKRLFEIYGKKSNVNIEFTELIENDPFKIQVYKSAWEGIHFLEDTK